MTTKRALLLLAPLAVAAAGLAVLAFAIFGNAKPCYACGSQTPPPPCGVNLSALTLKQGDDRRAFWGFLAPRPERVIHAYLGLNNNQGSGSPGYSYELSYAGDWDPAVSGVVTPTQGSGRLGPAGTKAANQTIELTIPYSDTQRGDLVITAMVRSTDAQCNFQSPVTATLRLNETGPTVWPITPRTCPQAGKKPQLIFGIRNPGAATATYSMTAAAVNPHGGSAADQFNLNGQGGQAVLPALTLRPGQTKKVTVSCETFGYCLTGGENRVELRVRPASDAEGVFEAVAWSSVTIRDPDAVCPEVEDWWFLMPPLLVGLLIGVPSFAAVAGAGTWVLRKPKPAKPAQPKRSTHRPVEIQETKKKSPGGKDVTPDDPISRRR